LKKQQKPIRSFAQEWKMFLKGPGLVEDEE